LRQHQGQALRALRNLVAAGRGRVVEFTSPEGMPFRPTKEIGPTQLLVRSVPIVLQKSQISGRQFSRQKTSQAVIAN
jgi:hypothetical protein